MANPFNPPTLSGFNASPPPNDGSQVTANQLDWNVHHIGKIGAPLKNYIDDLVTNANAAFATVDDASNLTRGTISDARIPSNIVRDTRTISAGSGLTGGGSLAANRTINVGQGDGISVSANAVAVNNTVIRTTGNQTMGGVKTFSNTPIGPRGGGFLSHDRTQNNSGFIIITSNEPTNTSGMAAGDIKLVF